MTSAICFLSEQTYTVFDTPFWKTTFSKSLLEAGKLLHILGPLSYKHAPILQGSAISDSWWAKHKARAAISR